MTTAGAFFGRMLRSGALAAGIGASAALAALAATAAAADPLAEVQQLYYGGQVAEATRRLDEGLAANANDPTLRFMKGVMLADAKHDAEATAIFEQLTHDYPDLAEPYNNLAALYAADARYDKARAVLEEALRVNPGYATAWENLGDVLVAMASQAYGRALRLDAANTTAAPKLAVARRVMPAAPAAVANGAPAAPASQPSAASRQP